MFMVVHKASGLYELMIGYVESNQNWKHVGMFDRNTIESAGKTKQKLWELSDGIG